MTESPSAVQEQLDLMNKVGIPLRKRARFDAIIPFQVFAAVMADRESLSRSLWSASQKIFNILRYEPTTALDCYDSGGTDFFNTAPKRFAERV